MTARVWRSTSSCGTYLIVDTDTKYSQQFRKLLQDSGTAVIQLPPFSPNLNAFAKRFVRSIKEECLAKMIFVGQGSLRRAISEYMMHYHSERNHQGLDNALIRGKLSEGVNEAIADRRQRLGEMLNDYRRATA